MSIAAERTPVTPGVPTELAVRVGNDGDVARAFRVRGLGMGEAADAAEVVTRPLAPGEVEVVALPVLLPTGFPACEHLAAVEAVPVDPADPAVATGPRQLVEVVLAVGDVEVLGAQLDPADVRGGDRGRTHVSLWNRTREQIAVGLSSHSPDGRVQARFEQAEVTLAPGELARVRAKLRGRRPFSGAPRRTPFTITVQGHTTPVHLRGSFTQAPVLSRGSLRLFAILAFVGLWAGLLVAGIDRMAEQRDDDRAAEAAAASSDGGAAGDDGEGGGGDGEGGGGDAAGGGGEGGEGGEGGGGEDGEDGEEGPLPARVGGKVEAAEPGGVTVTIAPVSLVDEAAQGASFATLSRRPPSMPKLFGRQSSPSQNRVVSERRSTVTDDDGTWAFGDVRSPGFYLVTFAKAGYAAESFIVETTEDGAPVNLEVAMEAGDGSLSGTIRGPDGQGLGGVDVVVSDGQVELATRTPTRGDVGSWSIAGLTTPGTYLVTASRRGFGTETTLVELGGGDSRGGVDLTLQPGVAAITGTVTSPEGPLGGIRVTATDGEVTRTSSTLTEGRVGTFTLPQLPIPGTYTLTFAGEGWLTQTQRVELTESTVLEPSMVRTTATVYGSITDEGGTPVDGVGITATDGELTFKNTSVGDPQPGAYELDGLPPGTYVITFDRFEYEVATAVVEVGPGELVQRDIVLTPRDPSDEVPEESIISGVVLDGVTGQPVQGETVTVSIPALAGVTTTVNPAGDFELTALPAGIHEVEFAADGYETVRRRARVGVGERATLQVELEPLGSFQGTVLSRVGNQTLPGISVELVEAPGTQTPPISLETTTDSFGAFAFTRVLPTGSYLITFSSDDVPVGEEDPYRELQLPRVIEAGTTVTEDVLLDRYPQLLLYTQQPNPAAGANDPFVDLTGVEVTITPVTPGASPARTFVMEDDTGTPQARWTVVGLLPGTYSLTFAKDGYVSPQPASVDLALNANRTHETVLAPHIGVTRGSVHWNRNGSLTGVPGATVELTGVTAFRYDPVLGETVTTTSTFTTQTDTDGIGVGPGGTSDPTDVLGVGEFLFDPATGNSPIFPIGDYVVRAAGYATPSSFPDRPVGQVLPDPFTLDALPGTLTGEVHLDVGAAPAGTVANVRVEVLSSPDGGRYAAQVSPHVTGCCPTFSTTDATWTIRNTQLGGSQVPAGDYVLRFSVVGGGFTTVTVDAHVLPPNQHAPQPLVELDELATITARAEQIVGSTVNALNGASFRLLRADDSGVFQELATASAPGNDDEVLFPDLLPGRYRVQATAGGHKAGTSAEVELSGGDDAVVVVQLEKYGSIEGTLLGRIAGTTTAQAGVTVTACRQDRTAATCAGAPLGVERFNGVTGQNGSFEIADLEPGTYDLLVALPGYGGISPDDADTANDASVTVSQGEAAMATYPAGGTAGQVILDALPAQLRGTVRNDADEVVQDVTITLVGPTPRTVTSADGTYALTGLTPGEYDVTFAAKANHQPVTYHDLQLQPGADVPLDPILPRRFNTIAGTITARYGGAGGVVAPLEGATISVLDSATGAAVTSASVTQTVERDQSGTATAVRYTVGGLVDGTYTLRFAKTGFSSAQIQDVTVSQGVVVSGQDAQLDASNRQVVVTVTSAADDSAVAGATVTLEPTSGSTGRRTTASSPTAAAGTVTISDVVPGSYTIEVDGGSDHQDDDTAGSITVPTGDPATPVAATAEISESAISGTVRVKDTESGTYAPASGVTVRIVEDGTSTATATLSTAGDGTYVAYLPTPGSGQTDTYDVEHALAGYTTETQQDRTVSHEQRTSGVNGDLEKLGSITVTVEDQDGAAAGSVSVSVSLAAGATGGSVGTCTTDATSGSCSVDDLDPNLNYAVTATAPSGYRVASAPSSVNVPVGAAASATVVLEELGSITVTVSAGGSGASGASVSVTSGAVSRTCTTSGTAGTCTVSNLDASLTYTVTVSGVAGYTAAPVTGVDVAPGADTPVTVTMTPNGSLTIRVQESDGSAAAATVTLDNGRSCSTSTNAGVASCTIANLEPGTYEATADPTNGSLANGTNSSCVVPADGTTGTCTVTVTRP